MSQKKSTSLKINEKTLLEMFKSSSKPLTAREIFKRFKPGKKDKIKLNNLLKSLEHKGKVISIGKGKAYGLTEKMDLVRGTLEMQNSGIGFVLPESKRRKRDIFIAPVNLGNAWPGDLVLAAIFPEQRGKNPEGRIVRVIERKISQISAKIVKKLGKEVFLAKPCNTSLCFNLLLDTKEREENPQIEEIVLTEPVEQMENNLWRANLIERLGQEQDIQVQEQIVKSLHDIPKSFPPRVRQAAQDLPKNPIDKDLENRQDLRDLDFVTIDGARAKDFDDAILVQEDADGYRLHVGIADVSHYVQPGSALDQEARERANSYYFPLSVEPMFPVELSNELCSLKPNCPRLAMVAEIYFNHQADILQYKFYPALISSKARLTYSQIKEAVLQKNNEARQKIGPLISMLDLAKELAEKLQKKRKARGTLDFDLPEPEILFNLREEPSDIKAKSRHFGHQIIEEFMIAANEAVAEHLTDNDLSCMYRVHEEPDPEKLESLFRLLSKTRLAEEFSLAPDLKSLQTLLEQVEGTELDFLVNRLLLRSMKQACYSPKNKGHFGLASECYCHFTSPIRRYADLIVHRSLKYSLGLNEEKPSKPKKLISLGEHLSRQERKAMEAEREMMKRATILFLQDKIGTEFSGIVCSIADFGFWVELNEVMAEGLVRLSSLTDDYYTFWKKDYQLFGERTGRIFSLGTEVRVRLINLSLSRQEIDLELLE